jgi:protein associated with RNAse G/E
LKKLTVYKLNENGERVWDYPAIELERGEHFIRIRALFNRDDIDLDFVVFARGDCFIEYFYNDRWYNVFAVHEGQSDKLKGWYCNICRPAFLGEKTIHCEDLALDLWVAPSAAPLILDEDEFAALAITAEERSLCRDALSELLDLAKDGALPR